MNMKKLWRCASASLVISTLMILIYTASTPTTIQATEGSWGYVPSPIPELLEENYPVKSPSEQLHIIEIVEPLNSMKRRLNSREAADYYKGKKLDDTVGKGIFAKERNIASELDTVLMLNEVKKLHLTPQSVLKKDEQSPVDEITDKEILDPSSHYVELKNTEHLPQYVPFIENLSKVGLAPVIVPTNSICDDNTIVVIGVSSSFESFERRQAIRNTWGTWDNDKNLGVKIIFNIGKPQAKWYHLQEVFQKESLKHNDLIQWNFEDSYGNLTLKTIGFMKWTKENCSSSVFMLKTDDDIFINIPNLLQLIVTHIHNKQTTGLLIGYIIDGAKPEGDTNSKWFTSSVLFKDRTFPKYLSGCSYLISSDQISALLDASFRLAPFWLEDVYITGMLPQLTHAQLIHSDLFWYRKHLGTVCEYITHIVGHELTVSEMYDVWKQLKSPSLDCSSYK